jgi:CBS domain-containing protein
MPARAVASSYAEREATRFSTGQYLDTPVRDIMSPGVVSISEDAALRHAYRAMIIHRVHAVLIIGRSQAKPLGWVTSRGLLSWLEREGSLAYARDAITERPVMIEPSASAREAVRQLSQANVSHLLVCHHPDLSPEGVVTALDLMELATR